MLNIREDKGPSCQ